MTSPINQNILSYINKNHISEENIDTIGYLKGRNVVTIVDNSGSMRSVLHRGTTITRWNQLKSQVHQICEFVSLIDDNGFDLVFLNPIASGKFKNQYYLEGIKDSNDIQDCFNDQPTGLTPLIKRINEVIKKYEPTLAQKKLILYIATDGINSDDNGHTTPGAMKKWVEAFAQNELLRQRVSINISLFSDEPDVIEEYNIVDICKGPQKENLRIDVLNLEHIEKKQFEEANNGQFYKKEMHLAKMLLGADSDMDALDEEQEKSKKSDRIHIKENGSEEHTNHALNIANKPNDNSVTNNQNNHKVSGIYVGADPLCTKEEEINIDGLHPQQAGCCVIS